jgi:hypothetical protein
MTVQTLTQTQQSPASPALPGTWKLAAGRAITLRPREPGILRVAHGQLWVTFDGPHRGPRNDLGDHFIGVGQQLQLRVGQRLVVEAWNDGAPAYFSWDPLPARSEAPRLVAVVQPLEDLRLAWSFGADAAARLVTGLARLAWDALAGRSRESSAECAFNAQSRACRAQGAMS